LALVSRGIPSWWSLFKQGLSNPLALVAYGLLDAILATYLSNYKTWEAAGIAAASIVFVASAGVWARGKRNEAYLQSFPGHIKFSRIVSRVSVLNDAGDVQVYYAFDGKNESDEPRRKMTFVLSYAGGYTLSGPFKGTLDGKPVEWKVTPNGPNSVTVVFEFGDLCGPHKPLPHLTFQAYLKGQVRKAFSEPDYWELDSSVLTDYLVIELEALPPVRITEVYEDVTDFWGETDLTELKRLKQTSYAKRESDYRAKLEVSKPVPTDSYYLYFKLEKEQSKN
jgi:hypothetical protein